MMADGADLAAGPPKSVPLPADGTSGGSKEGLRPEAPAETASTDAGAPALAEGLAPPNDFSRLQVPAGEPEATCSTSYSSASDYGEQSNVDHFQSVRREAGSTVAGDISCCGDTDDSTSATADDLALRLPPQPRDPVDTDATCINKL